MAAVLGTSEQQAIGLVDRGDEFFASHPTKFGVPGHYLLTKSSGIVIDESPFECGGIAQLGEHLICIQKVAGSIPVASTSFRLSNPEISAVFRIQSTESCIQF